jgi:uncharacterized protein with PIN domain
MVHRAVLRFYAELNDCVPASQRQRDLEIPLSTPLDVRALLAKLGVLPDVVELVLVNGASSSLDHPVRDGDRVSLYPTFEAFDVTPLLQIRDAPLRRIVFVADAHLGRLARYLRLLGFDTLFENDPGDEALVRIAAEEGRVLLSRDRALLRRRAVTHGLRVPATRPREQLRYILERLDLFRLVRPFTRCMVCNGRLSAADKRTLGDRVPSRVRVVFDDFWRCSDCGRIYWQGSHYDRLSHFVDQMTAGGTERETLSGPDRSHPKQRPRGS